MLIPRSAAPRRLFGAEWKVARLPADFPPTLMVIVDTEEEFDWSQPFSRHQIGVRSMAAQRRMGPLYRRYGIRPTYVVDYPVVSQPDSVANLKELLAEQGCLIGTHLQPWVNPPFDEQVSDRNSFPGNLPKALERAKLAALTEKITEALGLVPRIYKAGRYGLGPSSFELLQEAGYGIDLSALPGADLRDKHGPDFRRVEPLPYWVAPAGRRPLLELPLTRGYTGLAWGQGAMLEPFMQSPLGRMFHLGGAAARLGLLDRLMLTPEGVDHHQHVALVEALLGRGVRLFTLSYHSPSLMPGNTPYVRSDADLVRFIDTIERFLEYFFGRVGGVASEPLSVAAALAADEAEPQAAARL